jgi:hypothetical protein
LYPALAVELTVKKKRMHNEDLDGRNEILPQRACSKLERDHHQHINPLAWEPPLCFFHCNAQSDNEAVIMVRPTKFLLGKYGILSHIDGKVTNAIRLLDSAPDTVMTRSHIENHQT